jgi:hypothetical protein
MSYSCLTDRINLHNSYTMNNHRQSVDVTAEQCLKVWTNDWIEIDEVG